MGKLSKSDMPIDRRSWEELQKEFFTKKTEHFRVGTGVVCNNVRGTILRESLDGGTSLVVAWDDGTHSSIRNPNYRRN